MAITYEPIATNTLGTATQSITFTSIPATYTDLRVIIANAKTSNTASINMRFNADTGTNYSYTQLSGQGTAAYTNSSGATPLGYARVLGLDSGTSITIPGMSIVDIFSYTGSTFKTLLAMASTNFNGSGTIESVVNLWRSTSAITSVEVRSQSGTMSIGTTATLYGILKA